MNVGMLLISIALHASAPAPDPFAERLDEAAYLEALERLQLTEVMDTYISSRELDDPLAAAAVQLSSLATSMRDPGLASDERRALLDRRLAARSLAMDSTGLTHLQEADWRLDQAEDHLLLGLGLEYLGLTVMHGSPAPRQATMASRHVDESMAQLNRAEIAIEKAIWELEKTPASKRSAIERSQLVELRETHRDRRLPLLRGMMLVHAFMMEEDDQQRSQQIAEARESLKDLSEQLEGGARVKAAWLEGMVEAESGNFDIAEDRFRDAATDGAASRADVLSARIGGVANRTVDGGPDRGIRAAESLARRYAEPSDRAERILITDALVRLHLQAAATSNRSMHEAAAAAAWIELAELLKSQGFDPATADAFARERLELLPLASGDSSHLPGEAVLLQLRKSPDPVAIRALLERQDLSDRTRVQAMLLLSERLEMKGAADEAAEIAMEASVLGQGVQEGVVAALRAASLSMELLERDPDSSRVRSLARAALRVLCTQYPDAPEIDAWRLVAARVARQDDDPASARGFYESILIGTEARRESILELADVLRALATTPEARATAMETLRRLAREQGGVRSDDIGLVMSAMLLDDSRAGEASAVLGAIDRDRLGIPMQARYDALLLRCADGDADALVEAAGQVSRRGSADGGQSLVVALRTTLQRLDAKAEADGIPADPEALRRELLPLAEALELWLEKQELEDAALWALVADARCRCEDPVTALRIYDRMLAGNPNAGVLLAGRAEALIAIGGEDGLAQAMTIHRRLSSGGMESNPRRWWRSQLRMLEILDLMGRSTDRIAPRIRRLQQQDPNFGGADHRRSFERLLVKYQ